MSYNFPKMSDGVISVKYSFEGGLVDLTQEDVVRLIEKHIDQSPYDTVKQAINELIACGYVELPIGCINMVSTILGGLREDE